ncbi:MAG: hypothetical protein ABIK86_04940 [candidate division WOR-3 bacterium]
MGAPCKNCDSSTTWSHHEHDGCPSSPPGTTKYVFEEGLTLSPLGIPQPKPCPGCGQSVDWKFWYCDNCGYSEQNTSGLVGGVDDHG